VCVFGETVLIDELIPISEVHVEFGFLLVGSTSRM